MSLQARAIRDRVRELLLDRPIPHVGPRVFTNRTRKLRKADLPAVLLYMPRATSILEAEGDGRIYRVEGELVVETITSELEAADDLADEVEEVILEALFLDEALDGCARDCRYTGTDSGIDGEGDERVAILQTRWAVTWEQEAPGYRSAPDLEHVHESTSIGGEGSPVEEQLIPIPQTAP